MGLIADSFNGTKTGTIRKAVQDADMRPVDKQINKIIAIAKHKFHWGRKAIFNYVLDTIHDAGLRVKIEDAKNYKYSALLNTLTTGEKSQVIKRLEQIEKRNAAEMARTATETETRFKRRVL